MTKALLLIAAIVAVVASGTLGGYSPARLLRKLVFGTPFLQEPEGIAGRAVLWFCDTLSWLAVFPGAVRLFNILYTA